MTTPGGTSATSPADQFTYVAAADGHGREPDDGPAAGGTLVTITGTGFTSATAVDFGTMPATNFTVVSDNSITADSPAGTGTVDVTVTTPGGHVGHLVRRSVHLHVGCADGRGREPDHWSGGRRHLR